MEKVRKIETHKVIDETNPLGIKTIGGRDYLIYDQEDLAGYRQELSIQSGTVKTVGINGVTCRTLLAVVKDILEVYQEGKFPCAENADAIEYIEVALERLNDRTTDRIRRGVEGELKA